MAVRTPRLQVTCSCITVGFVLDLAPGHHRVSADQRVSTMLDPLTALSLAASIVQFVDVGSRLVETGYSMYKSADGATDDHIHLEQITADLLSVAKTVEQRLPGFQQSGQGRLSRGDRDLQNLGQKCQKLGAQLLKKLDDLRVEENFKGLARGWAALRKTFKRIWSEEDIKNLEGKLSDYRQQLYVRMLAILR
jgi:hypothetical protein